MKSDKKSLSEINDVVSNYFFITAYFILKGGTDAGRITLLVTSALNCLSYPYAKGFVENLALKSSSENMWRRLFPLGDPGNNGIYAIYYVAIYLLAIPLWLCSMLTGKN